MLSVQRRSGAWPHVGGESHLSLSAAVVVEDPPDRGPGQRGQPYAHIGAAWFDRFSGQGFGCLFPAGRENIDFGLQLFFELVLFFFQPCDGLFALFDAQTCLLRLIPLAGCAGNSPPDAASACKEIQHTFPDVDPLGCLPGLGRRLALGQALLFFGQAISHPLDLARHFRAQLVDFRVALLACSLL